MIKKIFSLCLLLACCYTSKAQNNLQFNRVVTLKADSVSVCTSLCADTILYRTFTVATGKVLKIESINYTVPGLYFLFFDATPFSKTSSNIANTFPIWLPPGTYSIYFGTYVPSASSNGNYAFLMSALEFNVVP